MVSPLDARRLLRESVPLAATLLFWLALSWVLGPGARYAGVVMALLYAAVRGVDLAGSPVLTAGLAGTAGAVRASLVAAVPAGLWLAAARLADAVAVAWESAGFPGAFGSPADGLAFVCIATAVLTVVLYAVAVGVDRVGEPTGGAASRGE